MKQETIKFPKIEATATDEKFIIKIPAYVTFGDITQSLTPDEAKKLASFIMKNIA